MRGECKQLEYQGELQYFSGQTEAYRCPPDDSWGSGEAGVSYGCSSHDGLPWMVPCVLSTEKIEINLEDKSLYNNKKYIHIYFLVSAPSS